MENILLVEDDLNLIDGLEYSIRKNGFHIDTARTVQEALSLYENNKFDLLVLDLTLPDGTGFEICQKVRLTSTVPIIFLTASDEEVNVVMGLDMGGDDYITKPFKLNEPKTQGTVLCFYDL
jgi:DNA-binding response OmpR family regulator